MADAKPDDQNTVNITSKWGGLSLVGKDAVSLFLFFMLLGMGGLTIYEHIQRSAEHEQIDCRLKLTLFMQTIPVEKPIDWRRVPTDVFGCVPKFLYERDVVK